MSIPELIMLAVVVLIGVPSAWRNPTAAALVLCWIVAEAIYLITGNGMNVKYYAFPDIFVIAVIFAKPEYRSLRPYRSTWHQLKCILLERSPSDRFILLSYPVVWYFYVAPIAPFYTYWALWFIAVAQYLASGWDALIMSIRRAFAVCETSDLSDDVFRRLAWEKAGAG